MLNTNTAELDALKDFIEDDPYYAGLWRGLNILVMEYLAENADMGLHAELNALFFRDLNSMLELVWALHMIEARREGTTKK